MATKLAMDTKLWLPTIPVPERPDIKSWLDPTTGRHFAINAKMHHKPKYFLSWNVTQSLAYRHQTLFVPYRLLNRIPLHKKRGRIPSRDGENRKTSSNFLVLDQTTLKPCRFATKHCTATGPRPIEFPLTISQDWFRFASNFANIRHKNVSNIQTRLLACVETTWPLRRRRAVRARRTATNHTSIESLYHLVFEFLFMDGVRYAVRRWASAKNRTKPPFRATRTVVNGSKYATERSETL